MRYCKLHAAFGIIFTGLALAAIAGPAHAERVLERLPGMDLPGNDVRTLREVPLAACEATCLADQSCLAFTYNQRARWCFLKSAAGDRVPYPDAMSAVVVETASEAPALPDLSFLPQSVARAAAALERRRDAVLLSAAPDGALSLAAARRLADRNASQMLTFAREKLTANAGNRAPTREATSLALGAAYLGLQNATSAFQQAEALAVLSAALEAQGDGRTALTASQTSVATGAVPAEQERLARLRRTYGFRVVDHSVDLGAVPPRLCVQFSEPLEGDADTLARFVGIANGRAPTVSAEERQLCVEGLDYGTRVALTVREGLPATTGERLLRAVEIAAYIRDRAPSVRFDADRSVLGPDSRGIPVTTVNTGRVDLALYRINDRNIADVVRRGDYKRQLYPWDTNQLENELGMPLWSGTMDVASQQNAEVRTLFPVREIVESNAPGVYVLTGQAQEAANRNGALATQWFVISDLGLSTYSAHGTTDAFVRSLTTGAPVEGAAVTLLARNDAVLAEGMSDADGHVRLTSRLPTTGATTPAVVTVASADGADYAFVNLLAGAFELTDRGVAGRAAPGPVDAFLATERGVYRGGADVHATVLTRTPTSEAVIVPVTLRLMRPDGKLSRRITRPTDAAGGLALTLPLAGNAMTGTWSLSAHLDPEGPAIGSTTFLVEDFVPQKIAVDISLPDGPVAAGGTVPVQVAVEFLYGAPAGGLALEGTLAISETATLEAYPGYRFGLDTERVAPERDALSALPTTGADGTAEVLVDLGDLAAFTSASPMEARIVIGAREPGGRPVFDALNIPVASGETLIGMRPQFEDDRAAEGTAAGFEVIAIDAARQRTALSTAYTLYRVETDYQWYRRGDRWRTERIERVAAVERGTLAIAADAPARVSVPVEWGRYRLEITAADGSTAASYTFTAGWGAADQGPDTPDVLPLTLDAQSHTPGDTARLRIAPRHPGRALVTVLTSGVHTHRWVDVPAEGTSVPIPIDEAMVPGAYAVVTLFHDPDAVAADNRPIPRRAVGVAHMAVGVEDRRLKVAIAAPDLIRPRQSVSVPVRISGADPEAPAYLTLAAVDVGILNVTGATPPDVDGHYLGQRRLAVELRDLYGELIDGSGAVRGTVRSGGDGAASSTEALPPNEEPVALFSGLVSADADGNATVDFDIPAFDGTLRLMAIAWSDSAVGDASAEMTVRDPVVVTAAMPRFLAPNDASRLRLDLHNVAHVAGDYEVRVVPDGPLDILDAPRRVTLGADERAVVEIPLAATAAGTGRLALTLTGPDGLTIEKSYTLPVRPAAMPITERRLMALTAGETMTLGLPLIEGFAESAKVTLTVGAGDVDAAGLLAMLDRFPYGCAEQTVSRALPLLYANDVARSLGLDADADLPGRIDAAIARVLGYQSPAGGFGLWGPGQDMWLTAYVMDFLTRAREAGFAVEESAFLAGLDRLQSQLSAVGELPAERAAEIAYASYVLARNSRAAIGDLRYFAEERLADFSTPLAKAQLGAGLALAGFQSDAARVFRAALADQPTGRPLRYDYGTALRDAAAVAALAAEAGLAATDLRAVWNRVDVLTSGSESRTFTTQEAAWLLLALAARDGADTPVAVGSVEGVAPMHAAIDAAALEVGVPVTNRGGETIALAATIAGQTFGPPPAIASGLTITRTLHTLDGGEVTGDAVGQNERLLVRLTLRKTEAVPMRLMLTDLIPAGFEIENPALVGEGAEASPDRRGPAPEHVEFRDDRFAAAWNLRAEPVNVPITVSYIVRAVSPGTFTRPGAEVVDMYQPQYVARTAAGTLAVLAAP